jgi:lipid II:glycine glycyltransferase (peptidoglycan interpeptide bridge formation enzyme)
VWQRFAPSARQAVRKAERSGLEVRTGRTPELLAEFYDLYEQSMVRWARQQHEPVALTRWRTKRTSSRRMLEAVADEFQESLSVWVAYRNAEPIASIIVLSLGSYAKYWRGAMNKEIANPTRANNLLHRLAIEQATTAGYQRYDMGESRPDSSLARYKASFGAVTQVAYEYWQERVPISGVQDRARRAVKQVIGFRDA